ncbi:MAG: MFS transporter [Planctomycetes bacterium]|nr:MFS transporter [Planctomycetota bacterium]
MNNDTESLPMQNSQDESVGRRNLKTFCAGAALNDIGEEMYAPLLPYFATTFLGITPWQYGFIDSFSEAVNRILKLFTGYFTDKVGRKVPVILSYILISLSRLGLPLVAGWAGFLPFRGLRQVGRAMRDPAREASIAESFPSAKRGRAFGILNAVDTIGSILGPAIGLLILYIAASSIVGASLSEGITKKVWMGIKTEFPRESYIWLFLWAGLPTIISAWIIYFFLFETRMPTPLFAKTPKPKHPGFSIATFMSSLKPGSPLRKLGWTTLSHMILAIGCVPVSMILLYGTQKLKAGPVDAIILFICYATTHFATSYSAGWLSDRLGRFRAQAVANGLLVLALLITIFARTPMFLIIPLVLYATFESIWIANRRAAVADLAREETLGATLGNFSALYGLTSFLCPVIFGGIWSAIGSGAALFVMALFPVAAIFVLPRK